MTDERREHLDLPDRRRNTYEALSNRLDGHIDKIEQRFRKRYRGMLIAFAFIGITSFVALGLYGIILGELNDTRATFVRSNCEATNARHDNSVNALILGSNADIMKARAGKQTSQGKVREKEIRNRVAVTIGLLDAINPLADCNYQVDLVLGKVTPTPTPSAVPKATPIPTETP